MKNKIFLSIIILLVINLHLFSQSQFRSGVFIHHSTGQIIWSRIPIEMAAFNTANGYTDNDAVSMIDSWFPTWNNDWVDWHYIFDDSDPVHNMQTYFDNNKIIIIKSCFPSSAMEGVGSPIDTLTDPWRRTIYNYKWHWRSIVRVMEQHPQNFFVIWTNAPLVPNATNPDQASQSDQFCTWAKDTLSTGLDVTFGPFPPNVYVFDFFHKLTDENGMLKLEYAVSPEDSHPNTDAASLVAPQFVNEIFNAAIFYEGIVPVELTLFSGYHEDGVVNLQWITATETNNFGFEVERRDANSAYESIGFVNGNGTSTNRVTYNFVDENLTSNKYYYRLKQIDLNGTFEYSNEFEIEIDALSDFQLYQNYPNPFNPATKIGFQLSAPNRVSLKVFDVLGNEVATIIDGYKSVGQHEVNFNASFLSSGLYFYQLKTGNYVETKKMILLK